MRLKEGAYGDMCGLTKHVNKEVLRYQVEETYVKVDVLTATTPKMRIVMTFVFSAPAQDTLSIKVYHHADDLEKHSFLVTRQELPIAVEEGDEKICILNGNMKVEVKKSPFSYTFYFKDRMLADSSGVVLVSDIDHDADVMQLTRHRPAKPGFVKERWLMESLSLDIGECIYGLGERFTPLVKNGQTVEIWNRSSGTQTDDAYKNIPFYLSSKSYGVFLNDKRYSEFEVGSKQVEKVQFSLEAEAMEYMVIGGDTPLDVLSGYTGLTGRSPVPPASSFGLWMSSCWMVEMGDDATKNMILGMKERGIPFSVYHFDADWMEFYTCCQFKWVSSYPNPKKLLDWIHSQGLKVCVWINPYISQLSDLFREGAEKGYFLKTRDGSRVWQTDNWMPGMAVVDFTNPQAKEWYTGQLAQLLRMGVDYLKTDFGEHIPVDVSYYDGSDPADMHNFYPYLYDQAVYEVIQREKGEREACIFGRAATVGSQKFPVNWGGDNYAIYPSMAEDLRGGLSLCQSGFSFWAHDMAGFFGKATPDLYKRWVAFGLLSTHSRLHGIRSLRVPWEYDEESCQVLAFFSKQKCKLMPYLYAQAVHSSQTGHPMMRAMMLDFVEDKNCLYLDRQYMLGDSLLVGIIFSPDKKVDFYVPDGGIWINYIDGERFEGGRWYTRQYDYFHMPLLVRPGSVIACGAEDSVTDYDYADGITFKLYGFQDGMTKEIDVYAPDGTLSSHVCATMENGEIRFSTTEQKKAWSVLLCGVEKVPTAISGKVTEEPEGFRIVPNSPDTQLVIGL